MLNISDVEKIIIKLSKDNIENTTIPTEALSNDVSCIIYRTDIFKYGDKNVIRRHMDIEFTFGGFYEINEDNQMFQYVCSLCNLQIHKDEQNDIILYQNNILA